MTVDDTQTIFYEKYKPQKIEDLVLPEPLKKSLQKFVDKEDVPNLGLFSSNPGTGKSSTAHAIITEIGCEALWINASLDKGIDVLRGRIGKFASQSSFDDRLKVVVMDEFDAFTPDGQKAFRGFIDEFSANCRFIFTGNYKEKIIQPLLDRLEVYDFNSFGKKDMVKPIFERLQMILDNEGISYDPKTLVPVINTFYPSIRSMVGALQKFSAEGKFEVTEGQLDGLDVLDKVMISVKAKKYQEMYLKVNELNAPDNMYTFLYKEVNKYFTPQAQPKANIILGKYQHMNETVRDKHLNLSACLSELMAVI